MVSQPIILLSIFDDIIVIKVIYLTIRHKYNSELN